MKWLFKSLATALVISSSLFVFIDKAFADIKLTLGDPTTTGKFRSRVTFDNDQFTEVEITVNNPDISPIAKAILLENAFKNPLPISQPGGGVIGQKKVEVKRMGNMLIFPKGVKIYEEIIDETGQVTKLQAVNKQKVKEGQLDGMYIE